MAVDILRSVCLWPPLESDKSKSLDFWDIAQFKPQREKNGPNYIEWMKDYFP